MSTVTATRTGRYNGYVRGKLGHGPDWSGGGQNQEPNLATACSPFPAVTTPTEDTGDTKTKGERIKKKKRTPRQRMTWWQKHQSRSTCCCCCYCPVLVCVHLFLSAYFTMLGWLWLTLARVTLSPSTLPQHQTGFAVSSVTLRLSWCYRAAGSSHCPPRRSDRRVQDIGPRTGRWMD